MIEKEGILLSKSRMVAGLDYINTGELNFNFRSLGIKIHTPVLDHYIQPHCIQYCTACALESGSPKEV